MGFDPSTAKPLSAYPGADAATSAAMDATDAAGGIVDVTVGPDGKVTDKSTAKGQFNPATAKLFNPETAKPVEAAKPAPKLKSLGDINPQVGMAEGAASLATGAIATPLAGLGGIGAAIAKQFGADIDPAEVIKYIQEKGTYQPKSEAGKNLVNIVSYPFEKLAQGADKVGGAVTDATGSPVLGTAANTAIQALPLAIGKGASAVKNSPLVKGALADADAASLIKNQQAAESTRITTASKEAGYALPPSEVNPSITNRTLEGASGQAQVAKKLSIKNQATTNDLVRKDIGLAPDVPATPESLAAIRAEAGKAYEAVKQVGTITNDPQYFADLQNISKSFDTAAESYKGVSNPIADVIQNISVETATAPAAIEMVKILRGKADVAYRTGDAPLGKSYKAAAQAIDDSLNRYLTRDAEFFNDPAMADAVSKYQAARERIAKTYTAEKSLRAGGNFDANVYAKELSKGRPLEGAGKTVAEFAAQFPRAAKVPEKIGGDALLGLGDIGLAAIRSVTHAGVAEGLMARPAVRSLITSKPYQNLMVNPKQAGPSFGRMSLENLADLQSKPIASLAEISAANRRNK